MSIRLVADGGNCCGLKHLFGFGKDPDSRVLAYKNKDGQPKFLHGSPEYGAEIHGVGGDHGTRFQDVFRLDLPEQSCKERFHALLKKLRDKNSFGLVQVTLNDGRAKDVTDKSPEGEVYENNICHWPNQRKWYPILRAAGFRQVNRWFNINSYNYVTCWQLRMDPKYYERYNKKKKTAAKPAPFQTAS